MATVKRPGTSTVAVNAHGGGAGRIAEGNKTAIVYTFIREQKYAEAVKVLNTEAGNYPKSRAALSLLGHCYYYMHDFHSAASTYVAVFVSDWGGGGGGAKVDLIFILKCLACDCRVDPSPGWLDSHSYEKLIKLHPEVEEYKMYYAQSLHKAGMFAEGYRAAMQVTDPQLATRVCFPLALALALADARFDGSAYGCNYLYRWPCCRPQSSTNKMI